MASRTPSRATAGRGRPPAAKKSKRRAAKRTAAKGSSGPPGKKTKAAGKSTKRLHTKSTRRKAPAERSAERGAPSTVEVSEQTKGYDGSPTVRNPLREPHPSRVKRAQRAKETHPHFGLPNEALVELWYLMLLSRRIAERWFTLNRQGRAPFVITGQGQEATQVGTAAALTPGKDWVFPYYRDIGVVLTLGMTADELMLNVFAKAADPNSGGRQMPTHWSSRELRIPTQSSTVTTQIPVAAGVAWAAKLRGEDSVVVAYLGEGSTSQGDFHEGLNFAAVHKLPLVVVVENNGYALTSVQEKEMAVGDVAERAAAYGIRGIVVDGNDVLLVYRNMQLAVHEARRGNGPMLLEAKTYRTVPHSSDDDDRRYRPREELEMWLRRDPIDRFREHLMKDGVLSNDHADQLMGEAEEEVRQAEERAEASADPDPATLLDHVFGGGV